MKKRKITYSMTARQKKELKKQQEDGKQNNENAEEGEVVVPKPRKTGLFVSLAAGILAVALIVAAICIPVLMSKETVTNDTFLKWKTYNPKDPENPYDDGNPNPNPPANPIVTFTLNSDDEAAFAAHFGSSEIRLDFELFMDDAPYASTNMLFLAESGFYDGTIINDVKNGHAMLNGFTAAADLVNKSKDISFMEKLTGFDPKRTSSSGLADFKLGYRLIAEYKRQVNDSFGYLTMLAGTSSSSSSGCSSTAFVIVTRDNSPQFNDLMDKPSTYMSWVGKLTGEEGQSELLKKLNEVPTTLKGKFRVPQFNIKIRSVRSDLSSAKKKYLLKNFESIISGGISSTWQKYAYNDTFYSFTRS